MNNVSTADCMHRVQLPQPLQFETLIVLQLKQYLFTCKIEAYKMCYVFFVFFSPMVLCQFLKICFSVRLLLVLLCHSFFSSPPQQSSFYLFFIFQHSTFVGSTWSFDFFIPATTANFLFLSIRLLSVLHGNSFFSSPPQRPMTSDFEGFSIPDFIHYINFPIIILEKEPVFPLFNVQC